LALKIIQASRLTLRDGAWLPKALKLIWATLRGSPCRWVPQLNRGCASRNEYAKDQ
jgi:hypothetical protein